MARTKHESSSTEKPKKRKRETNDMDLEAKRHRKDAKPNSRPAKAGQDQIAGKTKGASASLGESKQELQSSARQQLDVATEPESESGWTISKPMGGRMLDIDPILTPDEQ